MFRRPGLCIRGFDLRIGIEVVQLFLPNPHFVLRLPHSAFDDGLKAGGPDGGAERDGTK